MISRRNRAKPLYAVGSGLETQRYRKAHPFRKSKSISPTLLLSHSDVAADCVIADWLYGVSPLTPASNHMPRAQTDSCTKPIMLTPYGGRVRGVLGRLGEYTSV